MNDAPTRSVMPCQYQSGYRRMRLLVGGKEEVALREEELVKGEEERVEGERRDHADERHGDRREERSASHQRPHVVRRAGARALQAHEEDEQRQRDEELRAIEHVTHIGHVRVLVVGEERWVELRRVARAAGLIR